MQRTAAGKTPSSLHGALAADGGDVASSQQAALNTSYLHRDSSEHASDR
jgi:hypothetical protein